MPLDRPLPDEPREALKMLWSVCEEQQVDIYRHRDSLHKIWHVAPVKPREGMLVYADGTDWNPGSGAGYYVYYAGAWHAMSGGGGGGGTVTSVFTRTGAVVAVTGDYTAAQVTNAVSVLGSYPDPTWIPSYAYSKLTGVPTSFTPAAHVHAAADTTSGIFAVARLGSGTPSVSNWLRGDGAWTTLPISAIQTPWLQNINGAGFNLNNAGSVGIGTTPTVALDVAGVIRSVHNSVDFRIQSIPSWAVIGTFTNNHLAFYTNSTEKMVVASGGNVGIGTTAPLRVLDLRSLDTAQLRFSSSASGGTTYFYEMGRDNVTTGNFFISRNAGGATIADFSITGTGGISLFNLPTSSAGLAAGGVWIDTAAGRVLKIV